MQSWKLYNGKPEHRTDSTIIISKHNRKLNFPHVSRTWMRIQFSFYMRLLLKPETEAQRILLLIKFFNLYAVDNRNIKSAARPAGQQQQRYNEQWRWQCTIIITTDSSLSLSMSRARPMASCCRRRRKLSVAALSRLWALSETLRLSLELRDSWQPLAKARIT